MMLGTAKMTKVLWASGCICCSPARDVEGGEGGKVAWILLLFH